MLLHKHVNSNSVYTIRNKNKKVVVKLRVLFGVKFVIFLRVIYHILKIIYDLFFSEGRSL